MIDSAGSIDSPSAEGKIKVYFDGLCRLCSAEISTYRKMGGSDLIRFIDITAGDFDPFKEGLDPRAIHNQFHARDEVGHLHVGVPAFILIWSKLNRLKWLARWARFSVVKVVLDFAYFLFTKVRPYLPRKNCEASPYCEIKKK